MARRFNSKKDWFESDGSIISDRVKHPSESSIIMSSDTLARGHQVLAKSSLPIDERIGE